MLFSDKPMFYTRSREAQAIFFSCKNSGFEGPNISQSLSRNSGLEAISTPGLSTFEDVTGQQNFVITSMSVNKEISSLGTKRRSADFVGKWLSVSGAQLS